MCAEQVWLVLWLGDGKLLIKVGQVESGVTLTCIVVDDVTSPTTGALLMVHPVKWLRLAIAIRSKRLPYPSPRNNGSPDSCRVYFSISLLLLINFGLISIDKLPATRDYQLIEFKWVGNDTILKYGWDTMHKMLMYCWKFIHSTYMYEYHHQ